MDTGYPRLVERCSKNCSAAPTGRRSIGLRRRAVGGPDDDVALNFPDQQERPVVSAARCCFLWRRPLGEIWGAICAHRPTRGLAAAEWKSAGSRGSPPLDGSLFHVKPVRNSDTALSRDDGSILVTGHLARECRLAHRNQWWLLPFTNEPHG